MPTVHPPRPPWRRTVALLALALATAAQAEVKPLPRASWPRTVAEAVPHILAALTPAQRSIVAGTARDSLFLLRGEWGEDIENLLALNQGNQALAATTCGRPCPVDEAVLRLMEAAWDALPR